MTAPVRGIRLLSNDLTTRTSRLALIAEFHFAMLHGAAIGAAFMTSNGTFFKGFRQDAAEEWEKQVSRKKQSADSLQSNCARLLELSERLPGVTVAVHAKAKGDPRPHSRNSSHCMLMQMIAFLAIRSSVTPGAMRSG